jgi:2-polyprenyl-6-methoxyphenol hydroxylase-like FAD-dependent oxidoreductase
MDVAIAGCGPAGLAAALFLHRAGHNVRLFERFAVASPVGSGLMLQETGLAVLDKLGLGTRMRALGQPVGRLYGRVVPSQRIVLDVRFSAMRPGATAVAVHRAALFQVLHDAVVAAAIPIETARVIDGLDRASDRRPILTFAGGGRAGPFDFVVDATGARSPLAGFAGVPVTRRMLPYGALWASLPHRDGDPFEATVLEQRYRRASVMTGVLPVGRILEGGEPQLTFFWSLRPQDHAAWLQSGLDRWKEEVLAVWPATEGLLGRIGHPDALTLAAYGHHTLPLPIGDRIVFVGDSAHSTSPQLGQGANMALLDVAALDLALSRHGELADALAAYARLRRFHVRFYQLVSAAFTPFYQSDDRVRPALRDALFDRVTKVPGVAPALARLVAGRMLDPLRRLGLEVPE